MSVVEVEDLMENDITPDRYPSAPLPATPPSWGITNRQTFYKVEVTRV